MASPRDLFQSLALSGGLSSSSGGGGSGSQPSSARGHVRPSSASSRHGSQGSSGSGGGGGGGGRTPSPRPPASPRPPTDDPTEQSASLESSQGFHELKALVSLPFFENFDPRAARKLSACFRRRVWEAGEIVRYISEQPPASAAAATAAAAAAATPAESAASSAAAVSSASSSCSSAASVVDENAFHVLVRGRVEVSSLDASGRVVATLGQHTNPSYFGHEALVGQHSLRPVQVRALEQSIILSIGAQGFEQFLKQNPNCKVAVASGGATAGSVAFSPTPVPLHATAAAAAVANGAAGGGAAAGSSSAAASSSSHAASASVPVSSSSAAASSAAAFSAAGSGSAVPAAVASSSAADKLRLIVSLRDQPFFAQLGSAIPETKLQQLAALFEFRTCPRDQVLMREHEVAKGFYILIEGRISVSAMSFGGIGGAPATQGHQPMHLSTLTKGDVFGEIAILFDTLRTATLTAIQPCTLLFLSRSNFLSFLRLAPELLSNGVFSSMVHRRVGASLKTIPLFSCLRLKEKGPLVRWREDTLSALGALFRFRHYPAGSFLCREGEPAETFCIIQRGAVEVTARVGDRSEVEDGAPLDEEGNLILTELGQSDWFGEIALLSAATPSAAGGAAASAAAGVAPVAAAASSSSSSPSATPRSLSRPKRTASVRSLTDCVLLELASEHFATFLNLVPEIKHILERVMSTRTAQTLSSIPFFRSIRENKPWSKLSILGSMFKFESFSAGDFVVREGETGRTFYVICDGSVEVTKTVHSARPGHGEQTVVLDVLGRSCWFGEVALSRSTIRLATVRCREDCLFLSVTKEQFDKFCAIAPDCADAFSSLVTHRTANMLRSIPFFAANIVENKPWSKIELLCTLFEYEYFEPGSIIMREADTNAETNKLYVLSVGRVMMVRKRRADDPPNDPLPLLSPSPSPSPSPSVSPPSGASFNGIPPLSLPLTVGEPFNASPRMRASSPMAPASPMCGPAASPTAAASAIAAAPADPSSSSSVAAAVSTSSVVVAPVDPAASMAPASVADTASASSSSLLSLPPAFNLRVCSGSSSSGVSEDEEGVYRKILERGSYLNAISLLASLPRESTITTLDPCVFFTLTKEKFANFTRVCPELLDSLKRTYPLANEQEKAAAAAAAKAAAAANGSSSSNASTSASPAASSASASSSSHLSRPPPHARTQSSNSGSSSGGGNTKASHSLAVPGAASSSSSALPAPSRPLRHSSSFSSPFVHVSGDHAQAAQLGHSVLIDASAVHGRDGTIKHSAAHNSESPRAAATEDTAAAALIGAAHSSVSTPAVSSSPSLVPAASTAGSLVAASVVDCAVAVPTPSDSDDDRAVTAPASSVPQPAVSMAPQ